MEYRNIHQFAQAAFDQKAFRCFDVFKIDAAEGRSEIADAIDELVHVLGVEFQIDGVNIGKAFEQDGLAFHHRLGSQPAEIAETEHSCAVGYNGDHITLGGIFVGVVRIVGNFETWCGDARRIGQCQIALGRERLGRNHLYLTRTSRPVHDERILVEIAVIAFGHIRLR